MTFDPQSKTSEALLAAENGLREIGIDAKFSSFLGNDKGTVLHDKQSSAEAGDDEVYTLAGALENIVKACQLEILELQNSVDDLRTESSLLKAHVEAQSKELSQRKHRIEELEEKERVANESVEGLMLDIAAAEEEQGGKWQQNRKLLLEELWNKSLLQRWELKLLIGCR